MIRMAGMDQILNIYKNNISDDAHFYMFVDEVQFDKDWTNYLKMAYDMNPDMRSVATALPVPPSKTTCVKAVPADGLLSRLRRSPFMSTVH